MITWSGPCKNTKEEINEIFDVFTLFALMWLQLRILCVDVPFCSLQINITITRVCCCYFKTSWAWCRARDFPFFSHLINGNIFFVYLKLDTEFQFINFFKRILIVATSLSELLLCKNVVMGKKLRNKRFAI